MSITSEPGDPPAIDLTGIQPEAREIVRTVAAIYARHTAPWLIGLLVHGSAYKGGFIAGCSDIDLKLYLRDDAFHGSTMRLPFARAAAIQRELSRVDPAPFQYVQCYAERSQLAEGQIGPIPGAYHLVMGRLPVAEAAAEQVRASARAALENLDPYPDYIARDLLEHGGGRLARSARYACTDVWPVLYQVLCLVRPDPLAVWAMPKPAAIALLPDGSPLRSTITDFYAAVTVYYANVPAVDHAIEVLRLAVAFRQSAYSWWQETSARDMDR
jgi:hypothetical protein